MLLFNCYPTNPTSSAQLFSTTTCHLHHTHHPHSHPRCKDCLCFNRCCPRWANIWWTPIANCRCLRPRKHFTARTSCTLVFRCWPWCCLGRFGGWRHDWPAAAKTVGGEAEVGCWRTGTRTRSRSKKRRPNKKKPNKRQRNSQTTRNVRQRISGPKRSSD